MNNVVKEKPIKNKINSKIIEKILEKTKKKEEQEMEEDLEKETEKELEEVETIESFSVKQQIERPVPRPSIILEETFNKQENAPDATLEETLAGVETPKEKEDSNEFYSNVSYGSKKDEPNQKYENNIQTTRISQRREERGPITVGDIRGNQFTTNEVNPDVRKEMAEYTPQSPEEKYSVQNLERLDPTNLNRNRDRNPFLQDAERVETKYE